MKLIRDFWSLEEELQKIDIYHAYNGESKKYPKKFLEDKLIRRPNLGHYAGAADLINTGIETILNSASVIPSLSRDPFLKKYDYILVMSGDVWLIKPKVLVKILDTITSKNYQFATSLWPDLFFIPRYFASEFFIITPKLAQKIFPLHLNKPLLTLPLVEQALTEHVLSHATLKEIYLLPGRRLVWGFNRHYSPTLGYLSHHNLSQKILLTKNLDPLLSIG